MKNYFQFFKKRFPDFPKKISSLESSVNWNFIYFLTFGYFSLIIVIAFYQDWRVQIEQLKYIFFPSLAAIISIIFGLSNRNASISDRARTKSMEILKNIDEEKVIDKRTECLSNQVTLFQDRFTLNQYALVLAWITLILEVLIGLLVLISPGDISSIATRGIFVIVGLLIYSMILNIYDIFLGSRTLKLELENMRQALNKWKENQQNNLMI